jgi:hypothetical protein
MNEALLDLRELLRSQIVVWVRGAHLPHEVTITARGNRLEKLG